MAYDQSHLATMATRASTSSVMNPTLMLCLIVCPLGLTGAVSLFHFGQSVAASVVLAIVVAPITIACWQLIYFTKKEPARLQREQHNENMLAIRNRIEVKDGNSITQVPISNRLSDNPRIGDAGDE